MDIIQDYDGCREYRDFFSKEKDNKLIVVSANINGLQHEDWKAKNGLVKDFLLLYNVNIVGFQETNIN